MFSNVYKFTNDTVSNCEQILVKKKSGRWEYYANIDPISINEFTVFYLFFNELVSKKLQFDQLIFADEKGETAS